MAITKIGPPLAGIRGTIGGITYSENGSGPYAKQWATPSNPRTPNQTQERGFLGQMPNLWNDLTSVQKSKWDDFAALGAQELFNSLGESYFASGFNWFCKCNIRLLRIPRTTIDADPVQARPASPTIDEFRVTPAGSDPNLAVGGTPTADNWDGANVPANAFDGLTTTWWQAQNTGFPHWIRYAMPAAHKIKKFQLSTISTSTTTAPRDFTFESFNGATWDVLLTIFDTPPWSLNETRTFWVPTPTTARTDYRIQITRIQSAPNNVAIGDIKFFLADVDGSVIIYPEDDFANTPDYDLVLHIAPGVSTGKQVQYPGFLEAVATSSVPRQAIPIQTQLESIFGTILEQRAWFARLFRQTQEGIRSAAQTARTETI